MQTYDNNNTNDTEFCGGQAVSTLQYVDDHMKFVKT